MYPETFDSCILNSVLESEIHLIDARLLCGRNVFSNLQPATFNRQQLPRVISYQFGNQLVTYGNRW
jgi:hypothetical protein